MTLLTDLTGALASGAASHSRRAPRSSSERAVTAWQPAARASPSKSVSGNCARSTGSPIGAKWWTSAP